MKKAIIIILVILVGAGAFGTGAVFILKGSGKPQYNGELIYEHREKHGFLPGGNPGGAGDHGPADQRGGSHRAEPRR